MQEILAKLDARRAEIICANNKYETAERHWWCRIVIEGDGQRLEVTGYGPDLIPAIEAAWAKIAPIIEAPSGKVFGPPQLEAPKNDDLPF